MKRRLKNVAIMLSLFTMIGTTGEAAGRPKKPLNEKLTADKVKGKASKPRSYALPSKVVAQLNRTNKRVNENWYDIKKNAEAIVEEGKIRQAIDKVLGDSIKYEVIERKEVDQRHEKEIAENKKQIEEEKRLRAIADKVLGDSIKYEVIERKEVDEKQDKAIASNGSAIKHLDRKVNKGTSMLVAMSNVDFQDVNTGEVAIGAGVGHYVGDQAVAVGVAYGVNDDLKIHAKWSGVAGDPHYNAIGGGVTYKFRTR
ncbi:YadA-like family protein [Fusobacterium necrophorum]|uniref:YadA-like family protein n=1 Tax=Fusobacterium necrophorum TaxID=859 RepID=UPI000B34097C|nr:YadA-like family protein [Fusobacterium necrophorum]